MGQEVHRTPIQKLLGDKRFTILPLRSFCGTRGTPVQSSWGTRGKRYFYSEASAGQEVHGTPIQKLLGTRGILYYYSEASVRQEVHGIPIQKLLGGQGVTVLLFRSFWGQEVHGIPVQSWQTRGTRFSYSEASVGQEVHGSHILKLLEEKRYTVLLFRSFCGTRGTPVKSWGTKGKHYFYSEASVGQEVHGIPVQNWQTRGTRFSYSEASVGQEVHGFHILKLLEDKRYTVLLFRSFCGTRGTPVNSWGTIVKRYFYSEASVGQEVYSTSIQKLLWDKRYTVLLFRSFWGTRGIWYSYSEVSGEQDLHGTRILKPFGNIRYMVLLF